MILKRRFFAKVVESNTPKYLKSRVGNWSGTWSVLTATNTSTSCKLSLKLAVRVCVCVCVCDIQILTSLLQHLHYRGDKYFLGRFWMQNTHFPSYEYIDNHFQGQARLT